MGKMEDRKSAARKDTDYIAAYCVTVRAFLQTVSVKATR